MASQSSQTPIVIIGAGVSGCISALLLSKFAPVLLLERENEQAARQEARSINVTMCERGLSVFARVDELCGTTLREDLLSKGVGLNGRLIHTGATGLVPQPYGRPGQAIYSMKRSLLVKTCREAVESYIAKRVEGKESGHVIQIHYGMRYIGVEWAKSAAGDLLVSFLDSASSLKQISARLVVGADGAHSEVRKTVCQRAYMNYQVEHLGYGYIELSIPTDENETLRSHQNLFHFWPRNDTMMWAMANRDETFSSTFVMEMSKLTSLIEEGGLSTFLTKSFPDVKFAQNSSAIAPRVGTLMTVKCSSYNYKGDIVLIGDAAHTLVPFAGQGMNAALVDCSILYDCIMENQQDWHSALNKFTSLVKPNADAIADFAIANFEELRSKTSRPLFNVLKRFESFAHSIFPEKYIPLHTMINFRHDIPYAEATRRHQRQRKALAASLVSVATIIGASSGYLAWKILTSQKSQ